MTWQTGIETGARFVELDLGEGNWTIRVYRAYSIQILRRYLALFVSREDISLQQHDEILAEAERFGLSKKRTQQDLQFMSRTLLPDA